MYPCCRWNIADPEKAWDGTDFEIVENYGSRGSTGLQLHVWDEGGRVLARCTRCGGLILIQDSDYIDFSGDNDRYYDDFFPVESEEEAQRLNSEKDGYAIELSFHGKWLSCTNGKWSWYNKELER